MKEKVLVNTVNVSNAKRLIANLLKRKRNEVPGLGLIYGETGFGKTRFGEEIAAKNGWLYLRILTGFSERVFLQEVYRRLNLHINGEDDIISGFTAKLEIECINMMKQNPDIVFVIDEINLLFLTKKYIILEMIRDFIDTSFITVILIGEQNTYQKLLNYNNRFFDRCGFNLAFKANTLNDYKKICEEIISVEFTEDLVKYIHSSTKGNVRKAIDKMFPYFEEMAIAKGLNRIGLKDVK